LLHGISFSAALTGIYQCCDRCACQAKIIAKAPGAVRCVAAAPLKAMPSALCTHRGWLDYVGERAQELRDDSEAGLEMQRQVCR
jgi:hypothetical protein